MPRHPRDSRIETREARGRLKPGDLYTRRLKEGVFVGYWRPTDGAGAWYVRVRWQGHDGLWRTMKRRIAGADDFADADGEEVLTFSQAVDLALKRAAEISRADVGEKDPTRTESARGSGRPLTVGDALDSYLEWFAANRKSLTTTRAAVEAHIRPALGAILLERLTSGHLERWMAGLVTQGRRRRTAPGLIQRFAELDQRDVEAVRRRRATANRLLVILRAALTRAFLERKVASDLAWRRVRPFGEADQPKEQYLAADEARRLLNACEPDFRNLVHAALLTGCRYGELIGLRVRDYRPGPGPRALHLTRTKGGKARILELIAEAADMLEGLTAGRAADELVFRHADGSPWRASQQQRRMAKACEVAKISPPVTFHGLRDTFASWLAIAGVPLQTIATALGHADTRMTMRHYAHLQPSHVGKALRDHLPALLAPAPATLRRIGG